MEMTAEQQYTSTVVAKMVGKTPGRIRQICREYAIGTLILGRLRILSKRDVKQIEEIIKETGRN